MNHIDEEVLADMRLRLNIDYPDLEECYAEGYKEAVRNMSKDNNPYKQGTSEYRYWADGWEDGYFGEEPIFAIEGFELEEEPEVIDLTHAPLPNKKSAANDRFYHSFPMSNMLSTFWKISGALAATAVIGYQVLDLVA